MFAQQAVKGRETLSKTDSLAMIPVMTEDELENVMENFANEDAYYDKTFTRVVVENFFGKFNWYAPALGIENPPSLSKAYAYYEHVTLPRHFVGEQTADHVLRRAEPGETQRTELFSPWRTPNASLIEWGIGVDLYFSTLRIMAGVLFIVGLIHLPNLVFYRSDHYSSEGKNKLQWSLRGSAVCTSTAWVACLDCTEKEWHTEQAQTQFAYPLNGTAPNGTVMIQHNTCNGGNLPQGLVNMAGLFFLLVVLFLLSLYIGAREVRFDEDKLTSTDYSVIVKNPPKDAYNPDDWCDFFTQFAEKQVTAVTVALNNDEMLRKLIIRRIHRNNLRLMLPRRTDMNDEDNVRSAVAQLVRDRDAEPRGCLWKIFDSSILPILRIFNILLPGEILVDRVFQLTDEIKELQTKTYEVSKVFITFETEEGQRAALSALAIGRLDIMNNIASVAPSAIFQDQLLSVGEPVEPSAVRWLDLSATKLRKGFMRGLNLVLTLLIVSFAGFIVEKARFNVGSWAAAPLISIFNTLIPLIVKILMIFEPHGTEGSFQSALYLKITLFRWVNTAFLIKIITPWTNTLAPGAKDVLPQVNAILWSELCISPSLRLLDILGNFKKHVLAPRSRNQEMMNLYFQGTKYNLGERYTDLTKVLFVIFYYSALFPAAFFYGTAILIVQHYVDKFCLMRIWANSPFLGSEVAQFSRKYFFSGAVVAYAIISAYAWAGFPYDNLCRQENPQSGAAGTFDVTLASDLNSNNSQNVMTINVAEDDFFVYCRQNWRGFNGLPFPPTAKSQPSGLRWMGDSQEKLTNAYGWTAVALLAGFVSLFFGGAILSWSLSWFRGVYKSKGQKQNIDFSANSEIFGYVPQVKIAGFPFPFLACDVDQIDQGLIGWTDPTYSYDHHNVIFDVPWKGLKRRKIIDGMSIMDPSLQQEHKTNLRNSNLQPDDKNATALELVKPIFSIVKHYPPDWTNQVKPDL